MSRPVFDLKRPSKVGGAIHGKSHLGDSAATGQTLLRLLNKQAYKYVLGEMDARAQVYLSKNGAHTTLKYFRILRSPSKNAEMQGTY